MSSLPALAGPSRLSASVSTVLRPPCAARRTGPTGGPVRDVEQLGKRGMKDYVSGHIPSGATVRYPLGSKNILGAYQSRGTRPTLEDTYSFSALSLPPSLLRSSLRAAPAPAPSLSPWAGSVKPGGARGWEGISPLAGEVLAVGLYDGHGGGEVSKWLAGNLHAGVERALQEPADVIDEEGEGEHEAQRTLKEIVEVVEFFRSQGGYFRRWEGGLLAPRYRQSLSGPPTPLTLPERLTLAFLKADRHVLETLAASQSSGSTASVLLLHALSSGPRSQPFFAAPTLSLTVAHVGDTRVLLTTTEGATEALTESHHADARVELARLRRLAGRTGSVVDAFGEARWMGALENTRAVGDGRWKRDGVTAEPQISSRVLEGGASAFITLVTDGVSSLMTDQEVSDLAYTAPSPALAARRIVSFAEDIGGSDNCSAVVVPLAGWAKRVAGRDGTRERREWRRREVEGMSSKLVRR